MANWPEWLNCPLTIGQQLSVQIVVVLLLGITKSERFSLNQKIAQFSGLSLSEIVWFYRRKQKKDSPRFAYSFYGNLRLSTLISREKLETNENINFNSIHSLFPQLVFSFSLTDLNLYKE